MFLDMTFDRPPGLYVDKSRLAYFLQLRLLRLLVFAGLLRLSVELLGCELSRQTVSAVGLVIELALTLRLKRAFSRPDIFVKYGPYALSRRFCNKWLFSDMGSSE